MPADESMPPSQNENNNVTPPADSGTPPAANAGTPPAVAGKVKKSSTRLVLIVLAVLIVLFGGGYGAYAVFKPKPKPLANVKIGVLLAFSGGSSSMGYGAMKGIQLAKEQLAANNITLVTADGQCNPDVAPGAFKYLVSQHVVAVIG